MLDKIAGACSNGIVGAVAIAAGMIGDATAADMTAANIHTFKVCAFYVPLAVIILSGVVFLLKVKDRPRRCTPRSSKSWKRS